MFVMPPLSFAIHSRKILSRLLSLYLQATGVSTVRQKLLL